MIKMFLDKVYIITDISYTNVYKFLSSEKALDFYKEKVNTWVSTLGGHLTYKNATIKDKILNLIGLL